MIARSAEGRHLQRPPKTMKDLVWRPCIYSNFLAPASSMTLFGILFPRFAASQLICHFLLRSPTPVTTTARVNPGLVDPTIPPGKNPEHGEYILE